MYKGDIAEEVKKIRARGLDVSATTLLKSDTLRLVLMVLKKGGKLAEHHADGRLLLQVLEGQIEFEAENNGQRLDAGMVVSVEAHVPHAVIALNDAVVLLTIAWPSRGEEKAIEHRNVGYEA